jgi:hypothetical protein
MLAQKMYHTIIRALEPNSGLAGNVSLQEVAMAGSAIFAGDAVKLYT